MTNLHSGRDCFRQALRVISTTSPPGAYRVHAADRTTTRGQGHERQTRPMGTQLPCHSGGCAYGKLRRPEGSRRLTSQGKVTPKPTNPRWTQQGHPAHSMGIELRPIGPSTAIRYLTTEIGGLAALCGTGRGSAGGSKSGAAVRTQGMHATDPLLCTRQSSTPGQN